jgi:hypothetical protein
MRASVLFAASLALAGAAPAFAAALSAAEAKRVFFGLDMSGIYEPDGSKWRECIEPAGNTSYWIDGYYDKGRLRVREDGALCFSYASRHYARESCYTAERRGAGWRFVSIDSPDAVFLATRAKSVKACPTEDAPVS